VDLDGARAEHGYARVRGFGTLGKKRVELVKLRRAGGTGGHERAKALRRESRVCHDARGRVGLSHAALRAGTVAEEHGVTNSHRSDATHAAWFCSAPSSLSLFSAIKKSSLYAYRIERYLEMPWSE